MGNEANNYWFAFTIFQVMLMLSDGEIPVSVRKYEVRVAEYDNIFSVSLFVSHKYLRSVNIPQNSAKFVFRVPFALSG